MGSRAAECGGVPEQWFRAGTGCGGAVPGGAGGAVRRLGGPGAALLRGVRHLVRRALDALPRLPAQHLHPGTEIVAWKSMLETVGGSFDIIGGGCS